MIARHLIGLYVPAMALILTIDVSSNFLFSHMTIYSSFLRDGLAFGLAGVLFLNSRFNLRLFLSFFIILFILGILLGPMYLFYFVRLFIYLLLSLEVTRLKQNLNVFLFVPLFLLIAFFVFPNTEINQGFRFFIGNATVVGLILVCLHKLLKTRTKRLFTALGVFLTGSLAGIASLLLVNLDRPRLSFLAVVFIIVFSIFLPEGESARRLSGFAGIFYGDFTGFTSVLTLSTRAQQFLIAINSQEFSLIYGLSSNFFVSPAGIESQILHIFAYGGVLGIAFFSIFLVMLASIARVKMQMTYLCILLIYSLAYRWIESAASVFFLTLLFSAICSERSAYKLRWRKATHVSEKSLT